MKKKFTAFLLALIMVAQVIAPGTAWAINESRNYQKEDNKLVQVAKTNAEEYPKLTNKVILDIQKEDTENARKQIQGKKGATTFNTPYLPGQNIPDKDKPRIVGNVSADFKTIGLDEGTFDWEGVFGKDSNGNPGKAKLVFKQWLNNKETGVSYELEVSKDGKYSWKDWNGEPARIPLYSKGLDAFTYSAYLDQDVSEKVKLLTYRIAGTPSGGGFEKDPETGLNVADIVIDLSIQQVASTKFVSEWHTGLAESARPPVQGEFNNNIDEYSGYFPFATKDGGSIIIRNDFVNNSDYEDPGYSEYGSSSLVKTPVVKVTEGIEFADENDEDGSPTYIFDEDNKTITTLDKQHKFKYDFTYDVIEGGKLTMTEVIPVTFDANGGKFASLEADAEQKIVKEVDYDGTLTDKAENPTKPGKAFKGWATDKDGKTSAPDSEYENLKAAKTFYAIWSDEDIQIEELEVKESNRISKRTQKYNNDFVPTFEELKAQIKVKDPNGEFVELPKDVTFTIIGDKDKKTGEIKEYDKDSTDLKNFIYDKVKEKKSDEVSRTETVKAKITYSDGTEREVEIPIIVLKNIYKGTDEGNKYPHIPDDYVKVTIDPTENAKNPDKTYYYVNPEAKVKVPVKDPVGKDNNNFSKWTIKADSVTGDGADYTTTERYQFKEASTITAQYGNGTIKIVYVDQNGKEIDTKYQIAGQDYPSEKPGGLGKEADELQFASNGPDFKGYIYGSRDSIKGKHYKDPADPDKLDKVTYTYYKKVTTEEPTNKNVYFKVVFDANGGEFESEPKDKKIVYVYFSPSIQATVEKVTFKEVRDEFEKVYSNPTKDGFTFKEWQEKADKGSAVADNYEIQFKGWDSQTYEAIAETFYAHYGKASALISYLDLDGKAIVDEFRIDGVEYPTEKEGNAGEAIDKGVYTADTAPKFIGYKFNRIELNPANGKYALDNKATIKIYYEKLPDIIPSTGNEKPDGYVTVTFLPDDETHAGDKARGTLTGITKYYVNPKADPAKTMAEISEPTVKANQGFKVADPKWKDAEDNALTTATEITKDLIYTAQYKELDDIIPSTGNEKPEGYVTVTFDKGYKGESIQGETIYYVKSGTKFGEIKTRPTVIPEFGYEFIRWETSDRHIFISDGTVTAYNKKLPVVIPKTKDDDSEKPDGYVTVTLIPTEKATDQTKENKVFFVNPKEKVEITSKPVGKTEDKEGIKQTYEFKGWKVTEGTIASWDSEKIEGTFIQDTKITAQYKALVNLGELIAAPIGKKNVITPVNVKPDAEDLIKNIYDSSNPDSKDNLPENTTFEYTENGEPDVSKAGKTTASVKVTYPNGKTVVVKVPVTVVDNVVPQTGNDKPDVPDNYVKVTFVIEPAEGGKIVDKEVTTYYVNPEKDVTVPQPKTVAETGYVFEKWDQDTTTAKKYTENTTVKGNFKKLEDIIPGKNNEKPEGYVTVTFKAVNGNLEGETVYYVNGSKKVDLTEKAEALIKKPNVGYTAEGASWDPEITSKKYTEDATYTITFNALDDVIPQEKTDGSDKPNGYITVTFVKGDHGELEGNIVFYINPNKAVALNEKAPKVKADVGYKFADWDTQITKKIQYSDGDEITALYNEIDDVIPQEKQDGSDKPAGYLTVTFDKGEHGTLSGKTVYYVRPNKEVTVPAPTVTPETGWKQKDGTEAWDSKLTRTFTENTKITVQYEELDNVIPGDKPKPEGYVTVTFKQGDHGTIDQNQTDVYYVNPKAGKKLSDLKYPEVKADYEWKHVGWDKDKSTPINKDIVLTAQYLKKVLTEDPNDKENYVKVTFDKGEHGTIADTETKEYWVLKDTDVNITAPKVTPNKGYDFTGWDPTVKTKYSEDTTHTAQYKEREKDVIVVPGPSNPTDEKDPNKPDGGRVGGKDRTDTAIEISKKYFGQANTVIVVDRKDFPDAMTASVLSKLLNAPILLTETNRLDPRVAAEIQRLGARDVIIVGGNSSVSEAVKKELAKFDKDEVERIYGRDRYETSAQVARRVVGITGKIGHGVVASGEVFADALTVAPFAAREGYPILLVKRNSVPPTINKAIKDLSITKVTIAGGYSTVAKSLESSLPTVVERLRGNSRYETAIDIVNKKFNNANEIFLANGEQWMDALVIGPVGGILDIPILLTGANNAPKSLKDYIAKSKIEKITAIGGRSMVSDKVLNELSK